MAVRSLIYSRHIRQFYFNPRPKGYGIHLTERFFKIDEPLYTFSDLALRYEINEWLTNHCKKLWNIYGEDSFLIEMEELSHSVMTPIECYKPILLFEDGDDALLFKLTW